MKSSNPLDQMFSAFDQDSSDDDKAKDNHLSTSAKSDNKKKDTKKNKKKKNKKNKNKRVAEEMVGDLEKQLASEQSTSSAKKLPSKPEAQPGTNPVVLNEALFDEDEDMKYEQEGEMLQQLISTTALNRGNQGYDESDYVVETFEFPNCTHEYVAPKSYERPAFKRPQEKAK